MSSSGKVIDLQKHRTKRGLGAVKKSTVVSGKTEEIFAPIVNLTERRQEIIDEERRGVKRTLLQEFVGLHLIIPAKGLSKCTIYDISENGLAFDMGAESGQFRVGEMIALRVYMNHQTYFPFIVKISHIKFVEEEGIYRYGSGFQKDTINDVALFHFAKFIENVSAYLKTDNGDVLVSNLSDKR
ncbi:MAG: PilZ domain-containing protein [Bdellovibrionaceae bacterium]|nr:PilZ domain-containing protein [Pseudobdellovibrionaceae bacterium]